MTGAKLGLAALGVAAVAVWPGTAAAHVDIVLLIRAPAAGQHVGRNVSIVVVAQRALAGVDQTAFTAELDGRPVDPASGRFAVDDAARLLAVGVDDSGGARCSPDRRASRPVVSRSSGR